VQNLLLLDAGDALVGGGWLGDASQGEAIVAGMNLMDYDALALGPLELSLGPEVLTQRMAEAQFPMLSANVVLTGTEELLAAPYTILDIGGRRVGILGLTRPPDTPHSHFHVLDPRGVALERVPELGDLVDSVIVLTNVSYRAAQEIAKAVPGIDLLVAALPGQLPERASRMPSTGTLVVTAEQPLTGHTGRRVGRLAVLVESDGGMAEETWASIPLDNTFADDLRMQALLEGYRP
jgi:2',3'-cyclic-nucleotide 2'-phosphodiesterase (5'-nucleotidase family)